MPSKPRQDVIDAITSLVRSGRARSVPDACKQIGFGARRAGEVRRWLAAQGTTVSDIRASKPPEYVVMPAIDAPPELSGDWMVVNDAQLPTTDYTYAERIARIADRHLPKCEGLLINGDMMNMDAFSQYSPLVAHPTWEKEVDAAKVLIKEWLNSFERIVWTLGNHEHRILKVLNGQITIRHLLSMVAADNPRIEISIRDMATIHTDNGDWTVVHGANYSRNQLWNPNRLAQKFQTHVIAGHEHHWGMGMDDFKRYCVIANGGLFDVSRMAYVQLRTSTMPNMAKGFTMLKGGFATLFGEDHVTDWGHWLPKTFAVGKPKGKRGVALEAAAD